MNINDVYGGDFLNTRNWPKDHKAVTLTVSGVDLTTFESRDPQTRAMTTERQLVLHFDKTSKRFGLNRTNAKRMAHMFGEETDHWIHQRITLKLVKIDAFGELTDAIRVHVPDVEEVSPVAQAVQPRQATEPAPAAAPTVEQAADAVDNGANALDDPPASRFADLEDREPDDDIPF